MTTPSASAHESTAQREASPVSARCSSSRFASRVRSSPCGTELRPAIRSSGTRSRKAPTRIFISRRCSPDRSRSSPSQRRASLQSPGPCLAINSRSVRRGASFIAPTSPATPHVQEEQDEHDRQHDAARPEEEPAIAAIAAHHARGLGEREQKSRDGYSPHKMSTLLHVEFDEAAFPYDRPRYTRNPRGVNPFARFRYERHLKRG